MSKIRGLFFLLALLKMCLKSTFESSGVRLQIPSHHCIFPLNSCLVHAETAPTQQFRIIAKMSETSGSALPMPLAVTRTRGRSRSSSCPVRLFLLIACIMECLGQMDDGWGGQADHNQKQQTSSSCAFIIHVAPLSPPMFGNLFRSWCRQEHKKSLCCQPRTTSRRGQHADRDRHSQSHVATA